MGSELNGGSHAHSVHLTAPTVTALKQEMTFYTALFLSCTKTGLIEQNFSSERGFILTSWAHCTKNVSYVPYRTFCGWQYLRSSFLKLKLAWAFYPVGSVLVLSLHVYWPASCREVEL